MRPSGHEERRALDREILRLALPSLGGLAVEPLYVLVDTAIIGHLGTPQLGGVALAGAVLTMLFSICNFLAYATTALVARHHGASEPRAVAERAAEALVLALALGVLLAIFGIVVSGPAVDLLGASDDVRPHALTYLRISALGAPAVLVGLVGMGVTRGLQDARTGLVVAFTANAVNLVLEIVFVIVLDFGVAGSAWSTVVSQAGSGVVFTALVVRVVRAQGVPLRPALAPLKRFAGMGVVLIARTGALLGSFTVAAAVAARFGDDALAAHQIAFQLTLFLALSLDAIAVAGQAITGRLLGAGEPDRARIAARRMVGWGVRAGVVAAVAVVALRTVLATAFTDDPAVSDRLDGLLWFVAAAQPVAAVVYVLDGVHIGAGDVRYLALAMLGVSSAFVAVALAIGAGDGGLTALWWALTGLIAGRALAMVARFSGRAWLHAGEPAPAA
jgi:putative MATE family efflux protein